MESRRKRPRTAEGKSVLLQMTEEGRWEEAIDRVRSHPDEASSDDEAHPSPLALSCRSGAPYECVKAILDADPSRLRDVLDSRGTPLHEAIVCETTGAPVIEALLKKDEELPSDSSTRATLLQDVDGFTPLHLLIRRRFQTHILRSDEDTSLMQILEMLVKSCPDAVVIPDRGEYEEPPIVYAVKANIYAPSLGSEDATLARVERQIYEMVACMLKYCPLAASRVFTGYRGQYTALHSAVFHGRYTSTIELILKTEAANPSHQKAALGANTQGEMPLHFCAMRGERPRTVALIANAAPEAVLKRDASGLTPFHWLWIRFVSTLLALDHGGHGSDSTMSLDNRRQVPFEPTRYNEWTSLEQGDFDADLQLIKRMDPPVDFLRMRHIPQEVVEDAESLQWAVRSLDILKRIRERHYNTPSTDGASVEDGQNVVVWTRQETVSGLFWTKVVSLLQAAKLAGRDRPSGGSVLVHTAFASPCCLPSVAQIVASLFPEELSLRDDRGRLPIHYAASRPWHAWDWPREYNMTEPTAARLLRQESLTVLRIAMRLSPTVTLRVTDHDNRLVLHHVVDTFVRACTRPARSTKESPMEEMIQLLRDLVRLYPDALQRRDGVSKLYPFLEATAVATQQKAESYIHQDYVHDELPLSITYLLLRENPTLLKSQTNTSQ